MGMYSATKFALAAISDALRSELAGSGIGVSTIYPGLTQTSFMENMTQEVEVPAIPPVARFVSSEAVARRIVQSIRLGLRDAYISPEDIAAVGLNTIAPQLVDWTMRTFMGHPPGDRRGGHRGPAALASAPTPNLLNPPSARRIFSILQRRS